MASDFLWDQHPLCRRLPQAGVEAPFGPLWAGFSNTTEPLSCSLTQGPWSQVRRPPAGPFLQGRPLPQSRLLGFGPAGCRQVVPTTPSRGLTNLLERLTKPRKRWTDWITGLLQKAGPQEGQLKRGLGRGGGQGAEQPWAVRAPAFAGPRGLTDRLVVIGYVSCHWGWKSAPSLCALAGGPGVGLTLQSQLVSPQVT